jgi:arylsulfatase
LAGAYRPAEGCAQFTWNLLDLERVKWQSDRALAPGKHTIEYDFKYDGLGLATLAFNNISGLGHSGTGTLKVDGQVVSTQKLAHSVPLTLPWDWRFR